MVYARRYEVVAFDEDPWRVSAFVSAVMALCCSILMLLSAATASIAAKLAHSFGSEPPYRRHMYCLTHHCSEAARSVQQSHGPSSSGTYSSSSGTYSKIKAKDEDGVAGEGEREGEGGGSEDGCGIDDGVKNAVASGNGKHDGMFDGDQSNDHTDHGEHLRYDHNHHHHHLHHHHRHLAADARRSESDHTCHGGHPYNGDGDGDGDGEGGGSEDGCGTDDGVKKAVASGRYKHDGMFDGDSVDARRSNGLTGHGEHLRYDQNHLLHHHHHVLVADARRSESDHTCHGGHPYNGDGDGDGDGDAHHKEANGCLKLEDLSHGVHLIAGESGFSFFSDDHNNGYGSDPSLPSCGNPKSSASKPRVVTMDDDDDDGKRKDSESITENTSRTEQAAASIADRCKEVRSEEHGIIVVLNGESCAEIEMDENAKKLRNLEEELEHERSAAAIATSEAMAMISRLQEEKSAMRMEVCQMQRMCEEKAGYDERAMELLKQALFKTEREKMALEKEVELYRQRLLFFFSGSGEEHTGNSALMQSTLLRSSEVSPSSSSSSSSSSPSPSSSCGIPPSSTLCCSILQAPPEQALHEVSLRDQNIFSTDAEETQFILEHLWVLEEELQDMGQKDEGSEDRMNQPPKEDRSSVYTPWKRRNPSATTSITSFSSSCTNGGGDCGGDPGSASSSLDPWNTSGNAFRQKTHVPHMDGSCGEALPVHDVYEVECGAEADSKALGQEEEEEEEEEEVVVEEEEDEVIGDWSHASQVCCKHVRSSTARSLFSAMEAWEPEKKSLPKKKETEKGLEIIVVQEVRVLASRLEALLRLLQKS